MNHAMDTESRAPVLRLFDQLSQAQIESRLRRLQDEQDRTQRQERHLYCAQCGRTITREDQRIPMQGGHEHVFSNPHGFTFHIGCFATAPGCGQIGPLVAEWSWFQGYRWQVALCLGCGVHLGWRYRRYDGEAFHGLILKQLVSAADRH